MKSAGLSMHAARLVRLHLPRQWRGGIILPSRKLVAARLTDEAAQWKTSGVDD
jgi:hypothetical protein